jgi:hypothetical protein
MKLRQQARTIRLAGLAVTSLAVGLVLGACSSSDDGGDAGSVVIDEVLDLLVETGTGLRGVQAELSWDPAVDLLDAEPAGPFAGEFCEANVGSNFANLLCVIEQSGGSFDAPAVAWRVTIRHQAGLDVTDPDSGLVTLSCLATDPAGATRLVGCALR